MPSIISLSYEKNHILYCQEPREVILSQHTEFRLIHGQNTLQLVKESFQHVPILETLKALLNQPDVLSEVYQLVSIILYYFFHILKANLFTKEGNLGKLSFVNY